MNSKGIGDRNSCHSSSVMARTSSLPYNIEGLPICSESFNGADPFNSSAWDPIISESQMGKFGNLVLQSEFTSPNYPVVVESQASTSHLVHFPSDSCLADVVPKIPSFGSLLGHTDFNNQRTSTQTPDSHEKHHQNSGELLGTSPNGKRKRKNVEEKQKDPTGNARENLKECDEKKNVSRQGVKQAKDSSVGAEPCKEAYIHVRAKRGQATNSHSLAERVRRERISERMKMLQELVPGCNKITGKAVMLDEIINYVQSLQQQVEFLSMKLATVNPELNVDIQHILSKDILCSQAHTNNQNALQGLNSSHPFGELPQGIIEGFAPQFQGHPLPQNLWNNELQSIIQRGIETLEPNGLSKMEP